MLLTFTPEAWEDYSYWQKFNKQTLLRINELIKETLRSPFDGKGKPEPLRYELAGFWSRRIDKEHRFVYQATDHEVTVISLRFHYGK